METTSDGDCSAMSCIRINGRPILPVIVSSQHNMNHQHFQMRAKLAIDLFVVIHQYSNSCCLDYAYYRLLNLIGSPGVYVYRS